MKYLPEGYLDVPEGGLLKSPFFGLKNRIFRISRCRALQRVAILAARI